MSVDSRRKWKLVNRNRIRAQARQRYAVNRLTLSPNTGQTILDAVTTLAAAASAEYIMDGASTWHRIG
jgi:hypothetical protein